MHTFLAYSGYTPSTNIILNPHICVPNIEEIPPQEIQRAGHVHMACPPILLPMERDHFRDLGVDVKVTLKQVLNDYDGRVWNVSVAQGSTQ